MDSQDTIRKFENIVRIRSCAPYNPLTHGIKWYACIKYLDGHICLAIKSLLPIHTYLELGKN